MYLVIYLFKKWSNTFYVGVVKVYEYVGSALSLKNEKYSQVFSKKEKVCMKKATALQKEPCWLTDCFTEDAQTSQKAAEKTAMHKIKIDLLGLKCDMFEERKNTTFSRAFHVKKPIRVGFKGSQTFRHCCIIKVTKWNDILWLTRLQSCVSIMKLWTCFSALVNSSFLATTATTSAVQPAPCSTSTLSEVIK